MKTILSFSGFNKSKKMFKLKRIHLEDNETLNNLKNKFKITPTLKEIPHSEKRHTTISNDINDGLNTPRAFTNLKVIKTSHKKILSYNNVPSYKEIEAIDKYSFPHIVINPSIKRIITIPKPEKNNSKNKSLTLISKNLKNKLKKIQIITSPDNSLYKDKSKRKYLTERRKNPFKNKINTSKISEINKNLLPKNFNEKKKIPKFLSNKEVELLNNPDSIFYQIFNQIKSRVNTSNPIFQKPEDKLKEYYEDIKKNEEEAIKELYLLRLQFILSDQEKMLGKINSTNTFMDIKVKQLEG